MMTFVGAALVEVCSSLTPPAAHDAPISHLHSFANCPGTNTCSLQTTLQILKHKNQHQKAAKKTPWTRHHDVSNSTPHPSAHATPLGLLFFPTRPQVFLTFVYCCDYPLPKPPRPRRGFAEESCGRWAVLRHQHGIQRLSSHAALTSGLAAVQCRKMSSNMVEKFFTRFLLWEN